MHLLHVRFDTVRLLSVLGITLASTCISTFWLILAAAVTEGLNDFHLYRSSVCPGHRSLCQTECGFSSPHAGPREFPRPRHQQWAAVVCGFLFSSKYMVFYYSGCVLINQGFFWLWLWLLAAAAMLKYIGRNSDLAIAIIAETAKAIIDQKLPAILEMKSYHQYMLVLVHKRLYLRQWLNLHKLHVR